MGRRSKEKKREKRRRQKKKKKQPSSRNTIDNVETPVVNSPLLTKQSSPKLSPVQVDFDDPGFSSFGSPGTPPSPDSSFSRSMVCSCSKQPQTPRTRMYDCNERVSSYVEDDEGNIVLEDGQYMTYDEFLEHLGKCNRALAGKADMYRRGFEKLEDEIDELTIEHQKELKHVRNFYQQKILNSNSRAATMLKKALRSSKRLEHWN